MSDAIIIDPAAGYVALPASLFELDISPGAFRALSVLCNLADPKGFSWASLEQLADRVKRSKSSISAYLKELRQLNLIQAEEQKRSNGANYRLKIRVTFWADWFSCITKSKRPTPQRTERRVQPAERPIDDKHKSIETQNSGPAASEFSKKILEGWQSLQRNQPFGHFSPAPADLLRDTEEFLSKHSPKDPLPGSEIVERLNIVWRDLSVPCPVEILVAQSKSLKGVTTVTMGAFEREVREVWQKHWRKPPAPDQFAALVSKARNSDPTDTISRLVAGDYRRYQAFFG